MYQQRATQALLDGIQRNRSLGTLDKLKTIELPPLQKPKLQRIIHIMGIVSDAIGRIDDLDLEHLSLTVPLVGSKLLSR